MNLLEKIKDTFFTRFIPLKPGVYHYQAPPEAEFPYRLHLRVEQNGEGILIINASTVLHLNQTAAEYAYHLVSQTAKDQVAALMAKRYNVAKAEALKDFSDLSENLNTLISTPDLDPVTFFGFERQSPYSGEISAPYRLDCALTYKTQSASSALYAPTKRVERELIEDEWKTILDKAWTAGIPHVIFTGGEATMRPDLPDLIQHAENLGQVTGLLTNGMRLSETNYLQKLLQSGLDHLMILLDPKEDAVWEAIRDVISEDIFTTVHLTINSEDLQFYEKLLDKLTKLGVESLSLSYSDKSYKKTLQEVQQFANDRHMDLTWDLPVPYSRFNPVSLELEKPENNEEHFSNGAGKAWLYIEPDGDVLASQGMPDVLGNLLTDTWESVWNKTKS